MEKIHLQEEENSPTSARPELNRPPTVANISPLPAPKISIRKLVKNEIRANENSTKEKNDKIVFIEMVEQMRAAPKKNICEICKPVEQNLQIWSTKTKGNKLVAVDKTKNVFL